ncbi:MAG: DUF3592 domain-containing protein [Pyrinomonadaceae bacterium]
MMIFVGFVFFLIGLGLFANGIFSVFKIRRQVAGSVKATGTVVNFGRMMGKSGYLYCPQVVFADATGQRIEFQSELGTQPPAYTVGQQVPVIYQKNNPRQAEIDSLMALWFAPGCMIVMALTFTAVGLMLFGLGVLVALKS